MAESASNSLKATMHCRRIFAPAEPSFITAMLVWLLASLGLWSGCSRSPATPPTGAKSAATPAAYDLLQGKWQRPDGGYVLELASVSDTGALNASYFNPQPIRVGKAQASRADGKLQVTVELQDVNYPGSTYRLTYDPANDRLQGTYYQAVARETYEIFFERLKP